MKFEISNSKFTAALRKEILEQWRSYRLLVVAAVLVAFGLLSPLTAKYTPDLVRAFMPQGKEIASLIPAPTAMDAVLQYAKNISQFAIVLALLMAMGAVAQEKDKGTAALMLVKPLPRWAFLGAKFVALGLTFTVSIALAAIACYYYTLILFGSLDLLSWLAANGLMILFVLVYIALTLLCSTMTRSSVLAGGLAFGMMIVLSLVGAVPTVGEYLPGYLTTAGAKIMAGSEEVPWASLWVSLGIVCAALVGSWAAFERQEL